MVELRLIAGFLLVCGLFAAGPAHKATPQRPEIASQGKESAQSLYKKAQKAEKAGDLAHAYILYAEAAALDPHSRTDAWARSISLRRDALMEVKTLAADLENADGGTADDPQFDTSFLGHISDQELEEASRLQEPMILQASGERHDFDIRGPATKLYEEVSAAYGLEVVFDGDFKDSKPVRFRISGADYREALRILGAATNTFLVPVSSQLILVAEDTTQKRQELEHNVAITIPIPETVSVQETQELATAIRQTMEIKRLVIDPARGLVLIRDRNSLVWPAELLFRQLLYSRPEVVVEIDFLEFTESSKTRFGLTLPTSIPLFWLGDLWGNVPSVSTGITSLATFGGGATVIGMGIANAELFASMSRSNVRTILSSEVRSVSGQTATLHVGDRYPVQTQGYFGATEGTGEVYRPPPTINFEDLGIVVKVTPYVHGRDEVTLEVESEFKVLTGQALNGIPVIANRNFQSTVRLQTDEWAVMSGLMKSSEMRAVTGLAGLSQIPYLGALFRKTTLEQESGETLLVLKPRLIRQPASELNVPLPVWTGSESKPVSPL